MKTLIPLIILIAFTGCKQRNLNYVSYKYAECESVGNVGIRLDADGVHRCIKPKHQVKQIFRTVPKKIKPAKQIKHSFKNPSWLNIAPIKKCDTTITNVYKDGAVRCKGKILEVGQNTRIIRIHK